MNRYITSLAFLCLWATPAFAQTDSLTINRTTKRLIQPAVKIPSGSTLTIETGGTLTLDDPAAFRAANGIQPLIAGTATFPSSGTIVTQEWVTIPNIDGLQDQLNGRVPFSTYNSFASSVVNAVSTLNATMAGKADNDFTNVDPGHFVRPADVSFMLDGHTAFDPDSKSANLSTWMDNAFGNIEGSFLVRGPDDNWLTRDIGNYALLNTPVFSGDPESPTPPAGNNTNRLATTAFVQTAVGSKAPLASPAFTGTPTAPTAGPGTGNSQIATTLFVQNSIGGAGIQAGQVYIPDLGTDWFGTDGSLEEIVQTIDIGFQNTLTQYSHPAYTTITDGTTISMWCPGHLTINNHKVTLGGNRTLAISGATNGMTGVLVVMQDGTGGRTLALPSGSKVVNGGGGVVTLSSAPNAVDILTWVYDGTNYFWTYGANFN